MKAKSKIIGCLALVWLFATIETGLTQNAQDASSGITLESAVPIQSETLSLQPTDLPVLKTLSDDQLETFLDSLSIIPTISFDSLPSKGGAGTFYSLANPTWPPLPGDIHSLPVWKMGEGNIYLLNDLDFDYEAQATSKMGMQTMGMDVPGFDDVGGDSGGSYSPMFSTGDYGTNLWLAITNLSNHVAGLLISNTEPDVEYEIQARENLLAGQWISRGFVLGSELTNWTPTSAMATNYPTLFFRIKSWADSTGSGIPDWWQLQYFGTTGVDPYGDPDGDGWNNLQEFQNGTVPTTFNTPPMPQGLTATYNVSNGMANVSWQSSPNPVTGYTVERDDGSGATNFSFSASTNDFIDNISFDLPNADSFGDIDVSYKIQAHYAGGDSAWSSPVSIEQLTINASIIAGPLGTAYLTMSALPPNTAAIRLTEIDVLGVYNVIITNYDIPIGNFTNGLCLLTHPVMQSDGNPHSYIWFGQAVGTNGLGLTATTILSGDYGSFFVQPFFDGRAQLKQNLIFLLRSATVDSPFDYANVYPAHHSFILADSRPANYAYSSYYNLGLEYTDDGNIYWPFVSPTQPFDDNYTYRNFAFDASKLNAFGHTTTGVSGNYDHEAYSAFNDGYHDNFIDADLILVQPPAYLFQLPTTNWTTIPALMLTNQSQWLATYAMDSSSYNSGGGAYRISDYLGEIGITNYYDSGLSAAVYGMAANARNYFGLPFLSAKIAYNSTTTSTLYAGGSIAQGTYFPCLYPETAQPQFQTVEYDFWLSPNQYADPFIDSSDFPGLSGLSINHTNSILATSVGGSINLACFAKMSVQNGYSGVYGFLGQYFDKAYKITNGVVTTNQTGILSPYGSFFATEPGPTALVTMPDVDTGARGTATVYCVSLQLDANHDGNMDLSFSGADATSSSQPFVFWANNNFDRGHVVDGTDFEQDDLGPVDVAKLSVDQQMPDCNYGEYYGTRIIPSTRDLEDFARLWVCGVTSNLLAALPTNSTVTLSWGDVDSPNPANPTIDLFTAAESDGGTGYLTNSAIASSQINYGLSPFIQRLAPGGSVQLNANFFGNIWRGDHFIWCGVSNGSGGLTLTIADGDGNVLAQTTSYIQIKDIKQMYERWTVGEEPSRAPKSVADRAVDGVTTAFQYTPPQNTNTPYILFVHGWNMETWEKDRFAETAFKRLYWQGYKGRFGSFRWPTDNNFGQVGTGSRNTPLNDPQNFDNSEFHAWFSGLGLKNKLVDLKAEYGNNDVYLMAHSMGNVVAGEALRLAGTNKVVNTYIAMQAAIASHGYDATTPSRTLTYLGVNQDSGTPNRYANYYTNGAPCYFNNSAGAGTYANFFNTNDWALDVDHWQLNQNFKPDLAYSWNGTNFLAGSYVLNFPQDTYQIFSYCDEARCFALGAQASVGGAFQKLGVPQEVDLSAAPYNFGTTHKYHSGEFRSDNSQRWQFWNTVLLKMNLKSNEE